MGGKFKLTIIDEDVKRNFIILQKRVSVFASHAILNVLNGVKQLLKFELQRCIY